MCAAVFRSTGWFLLMFRLSSPFDFMQSLVSLSPDHVVAPPAPQQPSYKVTHDTDREGKSAVNPLF